MLEVVNDASGRAATTPGSLVRTISANWRLVALLVRRDLSTRYKRSVLGVWWTLLNPLLETAVLWMVFSRVFRFSTPDAPYVVYLLSGIVLVTLFRQTVMGVSGSLVNNGMILSRIHTEPEIFACAAALVVGVNFILSLIPLAAVMVLSGVAIPATAILAIVPAFLLLVFSTGIGMMLAPVTVPYPDVQELLRIALTLVAYLAPVFYPASIVPDKYLRIEHANPLFHFLEGFRALLYGGSFGSAAAWIVMLSTSAAALLAGSWIFGRSARTIIAAL